MKQAELVEVLQVWFAQNFERVKARAQYLGCTSKELLLRALDDAVAETLVVGDLRLEMSSRCCFRGEREIPLSELEFKVLLLLMQNANKLVRRDVLHDTVWRYRPGTRYLLNVTIFRLRERLGSGDAKIVAIPGRGYRLEAR